MQRSRVGVCLLVEDLAGWAFFDGLDAIFENRGPKVASTEDFLGSSISGHVTTIGTRVAVIQNMLSLLESYTSAENRVGAEAINCVPNDTV